MRTEIDVPNQGLGLEARWYGVSIFDLLVEEFKNRAQEPGFYAFLNDLVKGANNKGVLVKSAVNRGPNASEIILGKWVLWAAEKAYLEFLAEKNNGLDASQGARYLQLDEAAQRREDLLRLLHKGDRKVIVAEKAVGIKADALGDVVTRIQEWWENCSAVRKGAYAVAGIGAVLAGCVSTPYMPSTEVFVPETQPRTAEVTELPQPGVTIVTEAHQPTVTQNFGLNGQDEENEIWPAVVDPYSYIQKRIEEGLPVIPAIGIPQDQWDEFEAQNPGAQVDELVSAIEQNLAQNGVTNYTIKVLTAAEGMGGGWVVEVRDEKGNLMWSKVTEGGLKRWADHPNFNPNSTDVRIQSIPESDNMRLVVSEGNVIGVKMDKNGNITGIFQPVYNQIVLIPPEVAVTLELKPNVPETLINESLDLLDPNPKKSESGDWVLTNKIGKTFFRWNPDTGQWVDERPLYWQCGLGVLPNSDRENKANIQNEEVRNLPTGLRSEEKDIVGREENVIRGYKVRVCLTEINNSPGQTYISGKAMFFDLDGRPHEYPVRMGGIYDGKYLISLVLGITKFRIADFNGASLVLKDYWNDPSLIASRQIDMDIGTRDLGTPILDASQVNTNQKTTLEIIEAMRNGRGFTEEVPDGFFLWAFQLHFVNNSPAVWWFFDF